ncbi:hypothetical protein DEDE109153_11475 [Deinococcus deserti]|uniref:Uncharacterized protein n=1 Tax=Deinococcus deserti (strain DSM 17065 / CIP 109153 / LMG 22923 / VCD115) TaxID=546414 RepID=C1CXI8_DEIDV|nr:hypothetical protein [Deinococcus deserti]ACO46905.1 Conserved hypothetical protein; putative membrane protein [Deinococcus deserti VCD115]
MLQSISRDLQTGTRDGLIRASRRAYTLAFLALAIPGLPLGGLYLLTRPERLPLGAVLGLGGMGIAFAGAALWLAGRVARDPALPSSRAALTAAMQAASAPGITFLLGCALLHDLRGVILLWVLALCAYLVGYGQLAGWVREPQVHKAAERLT